MNTDLPIPRQSTTVPVMGRTGAGKSTFINTATESDACEIGHGLHPCTCTMQSVQFTSPDGQMGFFIDTPGLDHTDTGQAEAVQKENSHSGIEQNILSDARAKQDFAGTQLLARRFFHAIAVAGWIALIYTFLIS